MKINNTYQVVSLIFVILPSIWCKSMKKGVAASAGKKFYCGDTPFLNNVTWFYNWHLDPPYSGCNVTVPDSEFVQMQWGISGVPEKYTTRYVLGYNEPNRPDQACVDPVEGAIVFREMQNCGDENTIFVSPSSHGCGADDCCGGNQHEWFKAFFDECNKLGCVIPEMAVHKYGCNAKDVMGYLNSIYDRYGLPLWLTEFSCSGEDVTEKQMLDFMKEILPLLEEASHVVKYAWFDTRFKGTSFLSNNTSLFEADESKLTPLGEYYFGYMQ